MTILIILKKIIKAHRRVPFLPEWARTLFATFYPVGIEVYQGGY